MFLLILQTIESEDDRAFLVDLYNQNYQLLLNEANRIVHNPHDAEDAVQDFFSYVITHIERFRNVERCTMRNFLVMCIRRRSIDVLRIRETKQKHIAGSIDHDEFAFEYIDEKASFEEGVLNRIAVEELRDAFLKLPDQQQHVLEYKYLLGMTDREIGKILGVRSSTVRSYLARARKAVYQICKENGYAEE